ncbi:ATP-binding cassette domain-containing protein [Flavobacterium sp.]|uniref:ABC transporter ATP-binding protein n=1 Tax=Flavobacterium sp. TaxID=239 RepID=UPI0026092F43|nr:ATP-binding cassette domain-containing protein [Flavobacterium sp.]MDD3005477.1 ATP-binding cassette domain-containing protein [Flavobacterium sp.]
MEHILTIQNLNKSFGKIHAVKNLSLQISKGNVYGILGPNGSGKSTTLGIVLNVVNKTSGDFSWFDGKLSTHEALKKVGAIIERPNFYPYMTAYENLALVCKIKNIDLSKINEKLELVGLSERKNSKFRTFSLGMKQRMAIASALLNDPEILILDEPTNGLDPQGIHQIRDLVKKIASNGTTILIASHLLDEIEKICSHVLILRKGEMLYQGTVNGMRSGADFFELKAENPNVLMKTLMLHPSVNSVETADDKTLVYIKAPLSAQELNAYLFENNIILEHLIQRNNSLEEEFIKLISNS